MENQENPNAPDAGLEADNASSNQVTCVYISRYAPERSPTDPYMAIPWHLSQHTCFIGIWGPSRKLDASFHKHCRKIIEVRSGLRGWFESVSKIFGMRKAAIKTGFVVCGIDEHSLSLGLLAARVQHLQLFCIVQDPPFTSRYDNRRSPLRAVEKWIRTALLRLLLPCCQGIFCFIEKEVLRNYNLPHHRVYQMMNGASSGALEWAQSHSGTKNPAEKPIVGFIGAIQPAQGIDVLLEIFARARTLHPKLRLRLIGSMDASYTPEFQSTLQRLGIGSAVEVTGWQPYEKMLNKMEECYTGVYCNPPSEWFQCAQPLKVCEYLALGIPTIAWDYPGTRRLLDNGRLGLLISPADRPAFANALARLVDTPEYEQIAVEIGASLKNEWRSDSWYNRMLEIILRSLQRSNR